MLEEGAAETARFGSDRQVSRLDYLGEYIFKFTTYDSEYSEMFAAKALEVCAAISDCKTFEYIKEPERYRWYLLMCNMPFFEERIGWGGSIRGAWWGGRPKKPIEFDSCGLFLDGEQVTKTLQFTDDEWKQFIEALREFAAGDKMPNV